MNTIRRILPGLLGLTFLLVAVAGCASSSQRPPSAVEQHFFDVQTNLVDRIVVTPRVITITNEVAEVVTITNLVTVTNRVEEYAFTPNESAAAVQQIGAVAGNFFGVGGAVGTGLAGLFALWAQFRSRQNGRSAAELAQIVETARALIRSLPNGAELETKYKDWMVRHQGETDTIAAITALVGQAVDSDSARGAAAQILGLIEAAKK